MPHGNVYTYAYLLYGTYWFSFRQFYSKLYVSDYKYKVCAV